jgi:HEAT repeat protein
MRLALLLGTGVFLLPAAAAEVLAQQPAGGPDAEAVAADEQLLQKLKLPADGPSLLDYFRKRTFPDANPEQVAALIRGMGSEDFGTRERSYQEVLKLGATALFGLRKAENDSDPEVKRRVLDLRTRIEEKADPSVQAATARLIAHRKPAGAAEVLLAYLPFAANDAVVDEICQALGHVAVRDGKPVAAVVAALKDRHAGKRGAAAEALMRAKALEHVPDVHALLRDPEPRVRLRAGLGLVAVRDKTAIPALIDTLAELPPELLWPVEEVLFRLAGEQTPSVSLGTDEPSRKQARDVWRDWYEKNKGKLDLAALDKGEPFLNYTLVVMQGQRIVGGRFVGVSGHVAELDGNKKVRWKFDVDNTFPSDARVVGPDRVLVAEFNGQRVTERNTKGEVLKQFAIQGNPMTAQRLPGGNTFVVTQNRLLELDANGKEVWAMQRQQHDVIRASKLRNGEVVFITNQGTLTRLDPKTQKVLKTFEVGQIGNIFGSIDVLPNGNVLVPLYGNHRVVEFDAQGKTVWQAQVQTPTSVTRLPNGRTLVSSVNTRRLSEFDRNGREVWSHTVDGQALFQARKR